MKAYNGPALPSLPTVIPCDDCGVRGAHDDVRHAYYVVRSGKPKILIIILCPDCSMKRMGGNVRAREVGRDVAVEIFQHYKSVMEGDA